MAAIIRFYDNFMEERADPRVSQWIFMSSPLPTLVIIGIYLSLIYLFFPSYMKNRKPYDLRKIIKVYNIIQIVSCISLIYYIASSGWVQGHYNFGCQPVDYSDNPIAVRLLTGFYFTYLLKMVELVETIFFMMRKKFNQVSHLHVYHHASTLMFAWLGCKFIGGGMASVPIMINSFIHIMMYSYYYMSALGPKWQKKLAPWKPKLTMAQMIQFCILIIHSMTALQPSCHVPKTFLILYLPNVVLIFKMFYDFYKKSYTTKNHKKSK